jgi:hypothetical protein
MKVDIGPYKPFSTSSNKSNRRKIKVHVDRYDTFSLDHTLALVILPCLIQLKKSQQGIPVIKETEVDPNQESFDFGDDLESMQYEKNTQTWNEIIDKMIWSFQQLTINYKNGFDVSSEARPLYEERIQEGLTLFGTYYLALWE